MKYLRWLLSEILSYLRLYVRMESGTHIWKTTKSIKSARIFVNRSRDCYVWKHWENGNNKNSTNNMKSNAVENRKWVKKFLHDIQAFMASINEFEWKIRKWKGWIMHSIKVQKIYKLIALTRHQIINNE